MELYYSFYYEAKKIKNQKTVNFLHQQQLKNGSK